MLLILRVDNLNIVKWWVEASYAMHPDCKSHWGNNVPMMGISR